jgi:outer membrane lipoprotein-sorting protein
MEESMTKTIVFIGKWKTAAGLAAASLVLSVNAAFARDEASVETVLERMSGTYQSIESLGAELHQVKSYPQLGLTDPPEKGFLYVKRKAKEELLVRLEMLEPEQRIVTVKDGRYMLYQPKIKQAIEGNVDQKAGSSTGTSFMNYFLGDLSNAMKDYDIVSMGNERLGERETVHLRLTAKSGGNGYYPQIDLWVDKELWMPVAQEFVEPNRSVTKIRFEGLRLNEEIEDSVFNVKLPNDVERVKG